MDLIQYCLAGLFVFFVFAGQANNEDEDTLAVMAGVFWPVVALILIIETAWYCWKHR